MKHASLFYADSFTLYHLLERVMQKVRGLKRRGLMNRAGATCRFLYPRLEISIPAFVEMLPEKDRLKLRKLARKRALIVPYAPDITLDISTFALDAMQMRDMEEVIQLWQDVWHPGSWPKVTGEPPREEKW